LVVVPSKRFAPLLQVLIQPKFSAIFPAKMLDTSQPSSGKSTVGLDVGLTLGEFDGPLVGLVDGDNVGEVLGEAVGFFVGDV